MRIANCEEKCTNNTEVWIEGRFRTPTFLAAESKFRHPDRNGEAEDC
jgi:hypothetical protein